MESGNSGDPLPRKHSDRSACFVQLWWSLNWKQAHRDYTERREHNEYAMQDLENRVFQCLLFTRKKFLGVMRCLVYRRQLGSGGKGALLQETANRRK